MQTDHLSFFELEKPPFTKEIDDGQLWLPPSKSGVVDRICRAVLDRNSVSLVGDPGVGKTCVLRAVRCRLEAEPVRLTYCHNATLGRRDFYRQLCLALGLSAKATVGSLFWAVSTHVEQLDRGIQVRSVCHIFGHVHESSGVADRQGTRFFNAACNCVGDVPVVYEGGDHSCSFKA